MEWLPVLKRPSGTLAGVEDIERRCAPIFRRKEFKDIQWVGVFGSYARNKQHAESDVDLIVGFNSETTFEAVCRIVVDLKQVLTGLLDREADVIYMRDMEFRGLVPLVALLTAKTIYEAGPWLDKNWTQGKKYLLEGHERFRIAARLEDKISAGMAYLTEEIILLPENAAPRAQMLRDVKDLLDAFTFEPKSHPCNGYLEVAADWLTEKRPLVERHLQLAETGEFDAEEWRNLWKLLSSELRNGKMYLHITMDFVGGLAKSVEKIPRAPAKRRAPFMQRIPTTPLARMGVAISVLAGGVMLWSQMTRMRR